jgi:alginate O-acetyltransferase complex protein AlgJ
MPKVQPTINVDTGASAQNNWLTIALFSVMLLTPLLAQTLGVTSVIRGENRTLSAFPVVRNLSDLKRLPRQLDSYVDDRFGLRAQFVHLDSLIRYQLGVSSADDVVIGKDGWLFYTADDILGEHTGTDIFTPAELEDWVQMMEADRDWLAQRGIAFYILIAPEKNTIYPEMLPDYPRGKVTRIDQLAARLQHSGLEFIDPRQELFRAKAAGRMVYFAGDTHWLEPGAFVAYGMLMKHIRKRFPTVAPLDWDDYSIRYGAPGAADLAYNLTLDHDLHYTVERMTPKWKSHQLAPQKTFYRSDWNWRITENTNDLYDRPRLLIFGDSFTDYVLGPTMLYETFRDPVWTFPFGGVGATLDFNLVKEFKPQIVVLEMAERYLHIPLLKPRGFD